MESKPKYINYIFETSDGVSMDQEARTKLIFNEVGIVLENEWHISSSVTIYVLIQSDIKFRGGATSGPQTWKYCFLLRDQPDNRIYCSVDIFSVLPDDAVKMIKHETAHIIIAHLVNNFSAYKKSFFLEEGTAGLDGATDRLTKKLRSENSQEIPDPSSIKVIEDIKSMGGDTNKDPFIDQIGYLVLFSFIEYLKNIYGEDKIIELYKMMDANNFEEAFQLIYEKTLSENVVEWRKNLARAI